MPGFRDKGVKQEWGYCMNNVRLVCLLSERGRIYGLLKVLSTS